MDQEIIVAPSTQPSAPASGGPRMFTFGEPESVLDNRELWSYFQMWSNGRYYEPPLPMPKLAKAFNLNSYHRSAIALKVNLLVKHFVATAQFPAEVFERWATDFLQMGNGYLIRLNNLGGRILRVDHTPAAFTRVGTKDHGFFFLQSAIGQELEYPIGSVFHLQQIDVSQEIYGVPEWISALQPMLLNENATLFRRRYYLNGAHAGFIFYLSEALADTESVDMIEKQLASAKGLGNFRNLFVNIPGGKKDGVQIMPIADVAAKDEFLNIKNITRDDILAAHRTPPMLIGIIPQNTSGFGDAGKANDIYFSNEIMPIMTRMLRVNDWAGSEILKFKDYIPQASPVGSKTPAN